MTHFLQFITDLFLFFYLLLFIITIINSFNKKSLFHTVIKDKDFVLVYFIIMPIFIILSFFVNIYKILLDDEE